MAEKQYDNSNSGILSRNEEKDDAHPNWADFQGSLNVTEPGDYWIKAWVKEGKKGGKFEGKKFFSLALERKEKQGDSSASPAKKQSAPTPDIPF